MIGKLAIFHFLTLSLQTPFVFNVLGIVADPEIAVQYSIPLDPSMKFVLLSLFSQISFTAPIDQQSFFSCSTTYFVSFLATYNIISQTTLVDYGDTSVTVPVTRSVTISNEGDGDLNIGGKCRHCRSYFSVL